MGETPALQVRHLSKRFPGQLALDDVSFTVGPQQVHALVGHNGSGKSTLIKILSGFHVPEPGGQVEVHGEPLRFGDPDSSRTTGLRFIHQELGLVGGLSVMDNLKLGSDTYDTAPLWRIRWGHERRVARRLLDRVGATVGTDELVNAISPVQRVEVALARALQDGSEARVLVLDEPTASLAEAEVERLFTLIRSTVASGVAVIYVSHRLEEIYEIGDRVTVLRDGRVVGEAATAELPQDDLIELIVGSKGATRGLRRVASGPPADAPAGSSATPLLRVVDGVGGHLTGLSLEVRAGEIVGLAGLAGSGVHDLPELLLGRVRLTGGTLELGGRQIDHPSPNAVLDAGAAVLPSARELKSIAAMTVRENLTLPNLTPMWSRGWFRVSRERVIAGKLIEDFDIKPRDTERALVTLSGGNQQKVVVAKWLRDRPKLIVLDEPTAGVDVGGRGEILDLLVSASRQGLGVLICSSDLDDLAEICSRVVVVRDGRSATEIVGDAITRTFITTECYRSDATDD